MTGQHYTCAECGQLIEGADYDHAPTCSAFPAEEDHLELIEPLAEAGNRYEARLAEMDERFLDLQHQVLSIQHWKRRGQEAEAERDALAQTMWEARAILGFDNDGDPNPHAMIAGMGWEGYRVAFLDDMRQQRQDYDEALAEIPDD